MKKIMVMFFFILIICTSCSKGKANTPEEKTNAFFEQYHNLDSSVTKKIQYHFSETLNDKQLEEYIEIMKIQYEKMEYKVVEKEVNETDAIIDVEIVVNDLSSAYEKANSYISGYPEQFLDSNKEIDSKKKNDYILKVMKKDAERITYVIQFYYYKEDGKWIMTDLGETDLAKINGVY